MPPAHCAESADSNSSYGRSNDESLHLAHSRDSHQPSSGAASGYVSQYSWNTVALPQIPSASTQYSPSLYPGQTQNTYSYQSSPEAALGYFPPLNLSVTLPQMSSPHPVPLQIMVQPSVGIGNVPQLNISINLSQIPSAVPHSSFPTWPGQPQIQYQPPSEPTLVNVLQSHDRNRSDQVQSGSRLGTASTSVYPGQNHSTESRSFDTAFGSGQQLYDYSVPTQVSHSGQEQQRTCQRPKGGLVSMSEICTSSSSMGSGQSQSTKLPSFRSVFGSPTLSSRRVSTNETHYLSPRDMTPSLKRIADEIYPSGSELDSSGQSATVPSFEDAPRPRKRLKEADIGSTSCAPDETMQPLAATSHYRDSHNPESFPVNGCRISHDKRMDLPVQSERSIDRYGTQNDASILHGARNFRISGNPTFTNIGVNQVTNHSGPHDLESLTKFVSFDALHDSFEQDPGRRCHPGTRVNVLARLQGWMDDPSASEHIVWLHGLPGAGKSSIAQTIARLCGREKVVATFLFYRSDSSRNDGNRLFPTIAWQLASSIPGVKSHLVNSLTHRPDLPMKDVETQFEELVVRPFHALNGASSYLELSLAPVVVIDGVDECIDENLQRRILNVIGNAIRDRRIPLRFLILSRPEAHIKETVDQFECPTLCIDLDSIDNGNHDIELYFNAEFSRIAGERDFDTTWPGHHIIRKLVCNSSGQFVYAATVMKYVGDEFNCAKSQLDIILGLGRRPSASPFAPLDDLYTEILKRQSDQDFLKEFLILLVVCSSIDDGKDLHSDFPLLLSVSEEEMGRKLRGMQSLLAFEEGHIDIHHRSFLDFLQDVSRSGQYNINKRASSRRFLELITDTIVRYVSDVVIDQPQSHDTQHLHLHYWCDYYPLEPELAFEDLREVLQPLVDLQDKLLNLPNFTSNAKVPPCDECNVFETMRNLLLHFALSQAKSHCIASSTEATGPLMFEQDGDYSTVAALSKIEAENTISDKDLDTDFASLLAHMRNTPSTSSPTVSVLELLYSVLCFDCVEIANKVSSVLDAQNLVNLIDYMIHDQNSVKNGSMDLTWKAFHLVREIYERVPVLPHSIVQNENSHISSWDLDEDVDFEIEDLCSRALMARVLNHRFISSDGLILERNGELSWGVNRDTFHMRLSDWSRTSNASHSAIRLQIMLEFSKFIQYLHSVGAVLSFCTKLYTIYLDPEFRVKLHISDLDIKGVTLKKYAYENSIFTFGRLFYEMYFNVELSPSDRNKLKRDTIVKRPLEPEIREDAWQLIQRCCAEDPESRPTIDEVVQEMESWGIESEIATPAFDPDSDF